ncbi:MAG: DUF493 domain-containing protein [Pseudomonadota bacterium]
MTEDRPIQNFPDTYSIKAVGKDNEDFAGFTVSVVSGIIAQPQSISHYNRPSRNGKYLSVTISFTAQSQAELDQVFEQMSAQERVVWVI